MNVTVDPGWNAPVDESDFTNERSIDCTRPASIVGSSGTVAELFPDAGVVTDAKPVATAGFESTAVSPPAVCVVNDAPDGATNSTR